MLNDDGVFELEFVEDGTPGIFLPNKKVVSGRLSPAALTYFRELERRTPPTTLKTILHEAIGKRRRRKSTRREDELIIKVADFGPLRRR